MKIEEATGCAAVSVQTDGQGLTMESLRATMADLRKRFPRSLVTFWIECPRRGMVETTLPAPPEFPYRSPAWLLSHSMYASLRSDPRYIQESARFLVPLITVYVLSDEERAEALLALECGVWSK